MIFVGLLGCQKEDDLTHHSNRQAPENPPYKITTVGREVIQQNQVLNRTLKSLEEKLSKIKNDLQNRPIYYEAYNFIIETDFSTYIENEEKTYHSYTFPIMRDEDNGLLENLLLSVQEDGSYKTFIVSYDLTEREKEDISNGIQIELENRATFTEIDIDGTNISSEVSDKETCISGYAQEVVCWETACDIDGCWDPQYTGSECDWILVYYDCSGGGPNGTVTQNENNSGNNNTEHGGGGNGNTGNSHPDVTAPFVPEAWEEVSLCLSKSSFNGSSNTFTSEMSSWLQSQPKSVINSINDFLQENNCSNEAQDFGIEAIKAKMEDGEVDWEESLVYILPECLDDIVFDLLLSNNGKFSKVMEQFVGHSPVPENYNWSIIADNANGETSASASTEPNVKPGFFVETSIYIDNTQNATDISIARTIIHEAFHAYLVFVYRYQNIDKSYKSLLDEYASSYNNNANDTHHAFFILENLISEVAIALKEFGQNQGYNLPVQYYEDMAWGGLTHMKDPSNQNNYILNPTFEEAVPNTVDQQRILNRLSAEKNNTTTNGGIVPEGEKACP